MPNSKNSASKINCLYKLVETSRDSDAAMPAQHALAKDTPWQREVEASQFHSDTPSHPMSRLPQTSLPDPCSTAEMSRAQKKHRQRRGEANLTSQCSRSSKWESFSAAT